MEPLTHRQHRQTAAPRWLVVGLALLAAVLALGGFALWRSQAGDPGASVNDGAYFFRLTSKYMHGEEPVEFDIVVGCGVRVTLSEAVGSSYDAFRDPLFYVKATRDGAAVLQIVPDACQGQTTDNGRVPADFLPGAIWFDSKDDFTFGIAYIAEDAFENPKAKLKFLGAAIHPATKAEWEAFRPINAQNLLSPRWFSHTPPLVSKEALTAGLWNKKQLFNWWPRFDCYGALRYRLSEPRAIELLRAHWPDSHPRFWRLPVGNELGGIMTHIESMNGGRGPLVEGHYYEQYFKMYQYRGFSTRVGGGTFYSGSGIASKIFPRRAEDGLPWLSSRLSQASVIYRDIDLLDGANAGYAYCYFWMRGGYIAEEHIPHYFSRQFVTRIDGNPIYLGDEVGVFGPDIAPFFENDEYVYLDFHFGLQ